MFFLRDPWRVVSDNDTGFGNRLMCWHAGLILSKLTHSPAKFYCLLSEFPELLHLDIPNLYYKETDLPFPGNFRCITDEDINKFLKTGVIDIDPNLNYELCYSWESVINIVRYKWVEDEEIIKENLNHISVESRKITLLNNDLKNSIFNFNKNKIGLHIRRGNGVSILPTDINLIPEPYRKYYKLCPECDPLYVFQSDETILNVIREFTSEYKNRSFYISIDVDDKAIDYYKEKFSGKIFTRTDFIEKNREIVEKSNILNPIGDLTTIGKNILDFMILTNLRFFISDPTSSWSDLVIKTGNMETKRLDEKVKDILEFYELRFGKVI